MGEQEIEGFFDLCQNGLIAGWAWNPAAPGKALLLEIHIDGIFVDTFPTGRYRADLSAAGKGDGYHGFHHLLAAPHCDGRLHKIDIFDHETKTPLINTPVQLLLGPMQQKSATKVMAVEPACQPLAGTSVLFDLTLPGERWALPERLPGLLADGSQRTLWTRRMGPEPEALIWIDGQSDQPINSQLVAWKCSMEALENLAVLWRNQLLDVQWQSNGDETIGTMEPLKCDGLTGASALHFMTRELKGPDTSWARFSSLAFLP